MSSFAERLKQLRIKKSMTQKQVAEKLGITESAYGYYEQGKREPSQATLTTLSGVFDVSIDYLVTGSTFPVETQPEKEKFLKTVEENLGDLFFHDFDKKPEEMKEEALETLRMVLELQKKREDKRKGKE